MTALGAVPVLLGRVPSERTRDAMLGFAAGVMLSASFFSLIIPSLDAAEQLYGNGMLPAGIAVAGILAGVAVAVALIGEKYSTWHAFAIAAATGLVEPVGGLLGAGAVWFSEPLLPWALVFAAGAMIYVISHEIIPGTQARVSE